MFCWTVTVSLMRWVDGTLGYLVATLLAWVAGPARSLPLQARPGAGRILVMKFFGLGSIQLATPLLRAVRQGFPEARLTFLTFEQNAPFVRLVPGVDEVWSVRTRSPWHFLRDTLGALLRCRREPVHLVLDLEFFSKYSTALGFLSGSPLRLGYALPVYWRRRLMTHVVPIAPGLHMVDCFLQFARLLDLEAEGDLEPLRVLPEARDRLQGLLRDLGIDGSRPLVALNVNAGETSLLRRWPARSFAELAELLAPRATLAFLGSPGERDYVASVLALLGPRASAASVDLAGRLGPDDLVAFLERCSLLITNDSGPLHLAAGLGRPTVALFGPETPSRYGPRVPRSRVFYRDLACSPCLSPDNAKKAFCAFEQRCLREIPVQDVAAAALELLEPVPVEGPG